MVGVKDKSIGIIFFGKWVLSTSISTCDANVDELHVCGWMLHEREVSFILTSIMISEIFSLFPIVGYQNRFFTGLGTPEERLSPGQGESCNDV